MAPFYTAKLHDFLSVLPEALVGTLTLRLADQGFDTNTLTAYSWEDEINKLQMSLKALSIDFPESNQWQIFMEYVFPVIGKRVDCVILANDIILAIEYKGGQTSTAASALRQAQNYALDFSDFHEESKGRIVVPIALGTFKKRITLCSDQPKRGAAVSADDLPQTIHEAYNYWGAKQTAIDPESWNKSRYFPVPTIIEAATSIYLGHDIKDLASSRSGIDNLDTTQRAIAGAVDNAIAGGTKTLIIVTGVPGAGKTLAGLNAVQFLNQKLDTKNEQASFLSGNGPLVKVLGEAMKRSARRRGKGSKLRSVEEMIKEVHRFVRDTYESVRPPACRLVVFDEAQRAWTAEKNNKKFGRNISEPSMMLEIMGRHKGWAVVVALVGGGQEIHGGEAGLAAWGDALANNSAWEVITSHEAVHGGHSVAGSRLFRSERPVSVKVKEEASLHLSISKRSFETEVTAAWVNAALNGEPSAAAEYAAKGLPIYISRNLGECKRWLKEYAIGERHAGLIASSGAVRLRADGIETPTFTFLKGVEYTKWFLEPEGDYRSSNQLEVALSEFELQGLEIDLACLMWGGDLVFVEDKPVARNLKKCSWIAIASSGDAQLSADDQRTRILNKYRVLLTRFRKAMVVFVPTGNKTDKTREPHDFDSVFNYLTSCGAKPLSLVLHSLPASATSS